MINQHLIVGTYDETSSYFKERVKPYNLAINDTNGCVEIPTMLIKDQINDIYLKEEPQTGFIFYLLRNVINNPDGTFNVNINLGMEMIWIRNQDNSGYPRAIFDKITQHPENINVIEQLKSYATRTQ